MAHPSFIYGTAWKEERTQELTELALRSGFTAIDTANQRRHYVEEAVGDAVAAFLDGGRRREELFLQTKFTHLDGQDDRLPYDARAPYAEQVRQSLASSLRAPARVLPRLVRPARPGERPRPERRATSRPGARWRPSSAPARRACSA